MTIEQTISGWYGVFAMRRLPPLILVDPPDAAELLSLRRLLTRMLDHAERTAWPATRRRRRIWRRLMRRIARRPARPRRSEDA